MKFFITAATAAASPYYYYYYYYPKMRAKYGREELDVPAGCECVMKIHMPDTRLGNSHIGFLAHTSSAPYNNKQPEKRLTRAIFFYRNRGGGASYVCV